MIIEERTVIVKNMTLTTLTEWLNEVFMEKKNGTPFTIPDVQQYIISGKIPNYLGWFEIERVKEINNHPLYNVVKINMTQHA